MTVNTSGTKKISHATIHITIAGAPAVAAVATH